MFIRIKHIVRIFHWYILMIVNHYEEKRASYLDEGTLIPSVI